MDNIQFTKRVSNGAILRFDIEPYKQGHSSIIYMTTVYVSDPSTKEEQSAFSIHVTFVSIDEKGTKSQQPSRFESK